MLEIINARDLSLPVSARDWLLQLSGPTVVEVPGRDTGQWRAVSTLVHGNEPSGFLAAFDFLRSRTVPATNLALVISSVRAARHPPLFMHRQMPGEYDLNRRFGRPLGHDSVSELASRIADYLRTRRPRQLVDLHNTSGQGPAFGVAVSDRQAVKQLVSLFTPRMILTRLIVGSLMEQNFGCPVATIECGAAGDEAAHRLACEGLSRFAQAADLEALGSPDLAVYYHPVRVTVRPGISLDYGVCACEDVDITLDSEIEAFNSRITIAGSRLGWLHRELGECLQARDEQGRDIIETLFQRQAGELKARRHLQLFMATRRDDIALADCLFYAIETGLP